jgi:hypothetical protein
MSRSVHGDGKGTVKVKGLLSFMVGARETIRGPEVAPVPTVVTIDVSLQDTIVARVVLNVTKLPFCEEPNPLPVIVTWVPTTPDAGETPVIAGAGEAVGLTDTLSKVTVAEDDVVPPFTANPTYVLCAILMVWFDPSCVQFTPSADAKPLKVLPLRTTFTQYGRLSEAYPGCELLPPVEVRKSKAMLL